MHTIISAILIFLFWFLLSGHTSPLLIGLGVFSTLLTMYLSHRMNIIDRDTYSVHMSLRLLKYYLYLAKEIIIANLDVMKKIMAPATIDPKIAKIPTAKQSDVSKVTYANSITLTPGTVTMDLQDDEITVYALSQEAIDDLLTGRMASKVPDDEEIS